MTTPTRAALLALAAAIGLLPPVLLLFVTTLIAGDTVGGGGCDGDGGPGGGAARVGPRTWSGEQTANAQLITSVVIRDALPRRAAVIAVATAVVESELRNLPAGDRDSLGLFQQRPSQGWGTVAAILKPTSATTAFLTHLLAVPGWATMPAGVAEQTVQRSANPGAYAPQEPAAAALVTKFLTGPDNPVPLPLANPGTALQLARFGLLGCPDQGGSDIPLGPTTINPKSMPPGYQLPTDPKARTALAYAISALGKPYVWGATGPNSFDCSGLTQASWATAGVAISRTTTTQVHDGTPVAGLNRLQPGDLLFIPGAEGSAARPGHVGLYAGAGLVVDAYDSTKGVIVEKLRTWAPKIVAIRRVSPTPNATVGSRA